MFDYATETTRAIKTDRGTLHVYQLIISGEALSTDEAWVTLSLGGDATVTILGKKAYSRFLNATLEEIFAKFSRVKINPQQKLNSILKEFFLDSIAFERTGATEPLTVLFNFSFDLNKWGYGWSPEAHLREFRNELSPYPHLDYKWTTNEAKWPLIDCQLVVTFPPEEYVLKNNEPANLHSASLRMLIQPQLDDFLKANTAAIIQLSTRANKDALTIPFDFPPEVKTACQQYLLYFAEFLKEIGIEATAEITERAGKVLFSVTPNDKADALETIQEALNVYLNLPAAPNVTSTDLMNAEIAVQRLTANINHLKGELLLAQATMKMQAATIEAKEERLRFLELTKLLASGQVVAESQVVSEEEKSPDEDRETVIEGVLDVKRLDLWGAGELNLPEMLRRMKEWATARKGKKQP